MSIKPILFNTEMVKAIRDGRKSVTRRIFKGAPDRDDLKPYHVRGTYGLIATTNSLVYESTPPCVPGDILWVRETWGTWSRTDGIMPKIYYKADGGAPDGIKWHPSIHMPREAAQIFLRVKDVRVEHLKEIKNGWQFDKEGIVFEHGFISEAWRDFQRLWDSTIKPADLPRYGWAANPWVWVIEFERCEKPEGWLGT